MALQNVVHGASKGCRTMSRRCIHMSTPRHAVSVFKMPAMSPTMTEGGIASWKVKEGGAFATGDILLEIETDKATMDVEAQDDGILGKIVLQDGAKNVPVGKVIALLAEEGDDISNLEVPREEESASSELPKESTSTSSPPPPPVKPSQVSSQTASHAAQGHTKISHKRPLFPSVQRLLLENGISDANKIKGTGVRGMLTKGDVLAHLGQASSPWGTSKDRRSQPSTMHAPPAPPKKVEKVFDADTVRRLIVAGLAKSASRPAVPKSKAEVTFDDIIGDYVPVPAQSAKTALTSKPFSSSESSYLDGLS